MIQVQLSQLAEVLCAEHIGENVSVSHVVTDTRQIIPDTLFIALKGERFDAHDFVDQAVALGATALLVQRPVVSDLPQLIVSDTRLALGTLGAWLAAKMSAEFGLQTVALTGSCGKTTVKEMTASILAQKGTVLATGGNFNNDIGVPLTLLRLTPEHQFAVIELGANHPGEISYTAHLVKPQAALINNLAAAHLEGFGSLSGVAKAKGEIFEGLPEDGTAIINLESQDIALWSDALINRQVVTFSSAHENADFFARDVRMTAAGYPLFTLISPEGEIDVQVALLGLHNVSNALAAAALSMALGATLKQVQYGLANVVNVKGRVAVSEPRIGLRLIDDTYNASVASVKAAIDLVSSYEGNRWFVLGDMAELGDDSLALHREVGEYAQSKSLDRVATFGQASSVVSELNHGHHFTDKTALISWLQQQLTETDQSVTLLAKGARSSRMEDVITALQEKNS